MPPTFRVVGASALAACLEKASRLLRRHADSGIPHGESHCHLGAVLSSWLRVTTIRAQCYRSVNRDAPTRRDRW